MTPDRSTHDAVVLERVLDAPVDQVWAMWTDADHFAAWYGPVGVSVSIVRFDVRVGGDRLVRMDVETPDGPMQMHLAGAFVELVEGQRVVYTEYVADEHGDHVSDGPGDPGVTEIHVELEDLGGRTRMRMTHVGVAPDSPGASGWEMGFDKLAAHLATLT